MATTATTYLANPTVMIGAVDVTAMCSGATLTVGYDSLESTTFGDSGHLYVKGLQSVSVELTMFDFFGAGSAEATLFAALGAGTTTIVISPAGASESATNPEYTCQNLMLATFTPLGSATVGELAVIQASFVGGTFARDITP
jgi:hypothetical protein